MLGLGTRMGRLGGSIKKGGPPPVVVFTPASLFSASEQGAWYDPSDLTTLFQDSAGTTPVTAVEQPVGLMLDKSKGLVLGSEVSAVSSATITDATTTLNLVASAPVSSTFLVTFTAAGLTTDRRIRLGVISPAYTGPILTTDGTYSYRVYAASGTAIRVSELFLNSDPGSVSLTNISVRELPGNHAYQTSSTSRPTLRSLVNLLTYTEQFENSIWTKTAASIASNVVNSPISTLTADKIVENDVFTQHQIRYTLTTVIGLSYKLVIHAKAAERTALTFTVSGNPGVTVIINLLNGSVIAGSQYNPQITNLGDGWYRISALFTPSSTTTYIYFGIATPLGANSYQGDNTSGLYLWGADLRLANNDTNLPSYQRVVTTSSYDTSDFPLYLDFCESFGGTNTDNSMLTNSVDFSGTDKMTVFAGVRKLSDAAQSMLVELGNGITNRFSIEAPDASLNNFTGLCGGTSQSSVSSSAAAPTTRVLTLANNIAADFLNLRVNGVDNISTGDQGSGNHANAPVFIARRNNASLPFSGHIYSLIVRGSSTTDAQIAATEAWVNGKTRAY